MPGTIDAPEAKGRRSRWRDHRRVLVASLVLGTSYVVIRELSDWGTPKLLGMIWRHRDPAEMYAKEAAGIAARSRPIEAALSPEHPRSAFRLGVYYSYLSCRQSYRGQPEDERSEKAAEMQQCARLLGVGPVLLPVHSAKELPHLPDEIENDTGGIAARIEQASSPRLRHLFLLGAHVGIELARLEYDANSMPDPPSELIGKHATLASVPEPLWRPLTRLEGPDRETRLAHYQEDIRALKGWLARASRP